MCFYGIFIDSKWGRIKVWIVRRHNILSNDELGKRQEISKGKGYPDGLKEDEIPIWAQIVSIVDVYDALVSERVYKTAYDVKTAANMIANGECGVFSPEILDCFELAKEELFDAIENKLSFADSENL